MSNAFGVKLAVSAGVSRRHRVSSPYERGIVSTLHFIGRMKLGRKARPIRTNAEFHVFLQMLSSRVPNFCMRNATGNDGGMMTEGISETIGVDRTGIGDSAPMS